MRVTSFAVVLVSIATLAAPAAALGMRRPGRVVARATSGHEVVLSWADNNRVEMGYLVERRQLPRERFERLAMTARDVATFVDDGVVPGTRYRYRVRTVGPRSLSTPSPTVAVVTPAEPGNATRLPAPLGVTAAATGCNAVFVSWEPHAGVAHWEVRRDGVPIAEIAPPAVALVDDTLAPATTYSWTVTAVDGEGAESAASDPVTATTADCPGSPTTSTTSTTATSTSTTQPPHGSTTTSSTSTSRPQTTVTTLANRPPMANAGPDQMAQTLSGLTFSGSGSTDPDGHVVSWSWTFGDGATASGPSPTHAYAAPGTFTVTLTVTDDGGATASDTATARISNRAPVASAGADRSAAAGATVGFDGSGSSDADGRVVAWSWSFGDGATAAGASVGHAYATPGTYVATLTVTDDRGATGSDTAQVTVTAGGGGGGGLAWARRLGAAGFDEGRGIAIDGSGNVIVTGEIVPPVDLGGVVCNSSLFIAKYGPAGTLLWARCPGGGSGTAVAVDAAGNVAVTGRFRGAADFGGGTLSSPDGFDVFVARYAADGTHLWSRRFGGNVASAIATESGTGIAVDAAGNVFVSGYFEATADFGGGPVTSAGQSDGFVAAYGAAGGYLWARRFGGAYGDSAGAVAVDGAGSVLVTGTFLGSVDFGGGTLTAPVFDVFVAKYTSTGAHVWSHRFGGNLAAAGAAVAADAAGNVVVSGTFSDSIDFGGGPLTTAGGNDLFLARFSPAGGYLWSRAVGSSSNYDGGTGLAVDGAGNVLLAGYFSRTVDFGGGAVTSLGSKDAFVAKYAPAGTPVWTRTWGGTGIDQALAVAADRNGNVVATGSFFMGVDFGAGALTSAGSADVFLVRLGP